MIEQPTRYATSADLRTWRDQAEQGRPLSPLDSIALIDEVEAARAAVSRLRAEVDEHEEDATRHANDLAAIASIVERARRRTVAR